MLGISVQAANGTSYERMVEYGSKVADIVNADPNVDGRDAAGESNGAGSNNANVRDHAEAAQGRASCRPRQHRARAAAQARQHHGHQRVHHESAVDPHRRPQLALELSVHAAGHRSEPAAATFRRSSTQKLKTTPGFVGVNSDFDRAAPSLEVDIDRDRAAALGVSPAQIEAAMGYAFGGQQVSQIYASNDQYQVILELLPEFQRNAAALKTLYITSSSGTLVPLSAVTSATTSTIPLSVNHSGSVPAVTISFDLAEGYALSDAVARHREGERGSRRAGDDPGSFQGTAGAFQAATQNMGVLLLIAIVVVYIILGILYESFIHPLTILSGLPSAAVGALLTLYVVGLPLTLYAFVGMMMLIGIVKKNAIMMVDFALQKRRAEASVSPEHAIYEAALIRFRPIMMTTHGGDDGHAADRVRHRHGRRFAAAARVVRGGRAAALAAAHALHHAGDLRLSRPVRHALRAPPAGDPRQDVGHAAETPAT